VRRSPGTGIALDNLDEYKRSLAGVKWEISPSAGTAGQSWPHIAIMPFHTLLVVGPGHVF